MKILFIFLQTIFLYSCASFYGYSENEISSAFDLEDGPILWSPNKAELLPYLNDTPNKPEELKIFEFYCLNQQQRRKLNIQLKVNISPPPKEIQLNKALEIQKWKQEKAEDLIKNLYKLMFSRKFTKSGIGTAIGYSDFFAVNPNSQSQYPDSIYPSLILSNNNGSNLDLIFGLPHFTLQYNRQRFLTPKFLVVGNGGYNTGFVKLNPQKVDAYPNYQSENIQSYNTTTDLQLIESVLYRKYVIIESDGDKIPNTSPEDTWERYLIKNTSYKEAQTSDPNIIRYEISLDLNGFCKRARPITDMLSK